MTSPEMIDEIVANLFEELVDIEPRSINDKCFMALVEIVAIGVKQLIENKNAAWVLDKIKEPSSGSNNNT